MALLSGPTRAVDLPARVPDGRKEVGAAALSTPGERGAALWGLGTKSVEKMRLVARDVGHKKPAAPSPASSHAARLLAASISAPGSPYCRASFSCSVPHPHQHRTRTCSATRSSGRPLKYCNVSQATLRQRKGQQRDRSTLHRDAAPAPNAIARPARTARPKEQHDIGVQPRNQSWLSARSAPSS